LRGSKGSMVGGRGGWLSVMTDWQALQDVYGSAAGIPALLADAASAAEWDAPVWGELWSRLCHQGTVTPASYAALPALTLIAESRVTVPLDPALFLVASIIASVDGPPEITDVRSVHAAQIGSLGPVAERKLDLVHARADFLYALQTVAALEDLSVWQRELEGLVNEEVELECPSCKKHIYLELIDGALVATIDPNLVRGGQPVHPAEPAELGTTEARLLRLCHAHNQAAVGNELLQLFGQTHCPNCSAHLAVADALA